MADNVRAYEYLGWILNNSASGLYLLRASERMQEEVLARYAGTCIIVADCLEQKAEFPELIHRNPDADMFVLLNGQALLPGRRELRKLDESLPGLLAAEKNFLLCVTPDMEERLRTQAWNFYGALDQILSFEDEFAEPERRGLAGLLDRLRGSAGARREKDADADDSLPPGRQAVRGNATCTQWCVRQRSTTAAPSRAPAGRR